MTSTCAVLHCQNPGDVPVELNTPGNPVLETLVCKDHEAQMESGAHWGWSEVAQAVLIGPDVEGAAT